MCAILDANVVGKVFGTDCSAAGKAFFRWIDEGRGRLVVGGRLLRELDKNPAFTAWRFQAVLAGRIELLNEDAVDEKTSQLREANACRSDDEHVVAAALVGGARLLYSNDRKLQRDFKDRRLIDQPPGKVYSTLRGDAFTKNKRQLLAGSSCDKLRPGGNRR